MKQLFTILICCLFFASLAFSAENEILPGADITVRFYNRTVYYPGNSPSEPIEVNIIIANNGSRPLRFKLADDRFFSLNFIAVNTRNQSVPPTDKWMQKRSTNQKTFYRDISIEPGEAYSFTENVKDYLSFTVPGIYILNCAFYPELKTLSGDVEPSVRSDKLTLEIKPTPGAASVKLLPFSTKMQDVLKAESLPPDQVVTYMLTARQRSNWDQFFLYIDLEQMLSRDPARNRSFRNVSENDRFAMIENYKMELTQSKIDKDISTIPVEFKIERTSYTETEGTVTVLEKFDYRTYREIKRFTYYLTTRDGIWYVNNYTVDNLGTE